MNNNNKVHLQLLLSQSITTNAVEYTAMNLKLKRFSEDISLILAAGGIIQSKNGALVEEEASSTPKLRKKLQ